MVEKAVCIVIVAYNTKRFWPRQRRALEAQTLQGFSILVIDNASRHDERLSAADMPAGAALIQLEENLGFAAANNLAAERTDAEFLALLNPDAFPDPDWLERLVSAAARHPEAAAFGSLQLLDSDSSRLDGAGDCYWAGGLPYRALHARKRPPALTNRETFSACAAAALYRRDAFRAVGGFDARFFAYCEDVDLGFRLRLAGAPTMQVNDAVVSHVGGGAGAGARARFYGARNRVWTFVKCMPAPLFWPLAPIHVAAALAVASAHALTGRGLASFRGLAAALRHLPEIWRTRREIQNRRKASARAIAAALIWDPFAPLLRRPKAPQSAARA